MHATDDIICNLGIIVKTRKHIENKVTYFYYTSLIEPKNVKEALLDES